jgi:CDP-diacylglycerol pyrophosphatase
MRRIVRWLSNRSIAAAAAILATLVIAAVAVRAYDPNALWRIVHDRCLPNELKRGDPAPCAKVDLEGGVERGYAVLKDIRGATQFLLIPTARVVGIESPSLLAPDAPNYFAAAWRARSFVEKALGRALPRDAIGLAINSTRARSQNQLHIHIDCIRADVRQTLRAERATIGARWTPLGAPLGGNRYQAMRVMGQTLDGHEPFKLLADGIPGARAEMGAHTLVVVGMVFDGGEPGFVILDDHVDLVHGDFADGAQLEDHACAPAQ